MKALGERESTKHQILINSCLSEKVLIDWMISSIASMENDYNWQCYSNYVNASNKDMNIKGKHFQAAKC